MKCRAVCGIRVWKSIDAEAEEVFKTDYEFECANEQAAKAKCTRLVNAESKMQDITGAVLLKERGELPDWWTGDKPEWEAWADVKRETYQQDSNFIYAECQRISRLDFVTLGSEKTSSNVRAYIRLERRRKKGLQPWVKVSKIV